MILGFEIQNDKGRVFFVCCHSHISGLRMGSESDFWFWVLGMSQWQFSIVCWRTRRFGPGPASTSSLMGWQDYGIEEDTGYSIFLFNVLTHSCFESISNYMQFLQMEDESGKVGSWIKGVNQTKDLLIHCYCLLKNSKNQWRVILRVVTNYFIISLQLCHDKL